MTIKFQKLLEITAVPTGPWIAQPKLNGVAAAYHNGALYSKTLKQFPSDRFAHILADLAEYSGPPLFGELWHPEKTLPQISGLCNHYSSGEPNRLMFVYYDVQSDGGYERRCKRWFNIAQTENVRDINKLPTNYATLEDAIDGTVYRYPGGIFVPGPTPTTNIRKLKKWKELDADVIGSAPGTGEFNGLVGSLTCTHKGVRFSVGSGLDIADRVRYITCLPKRVKVRYLNLSVDGVPLNPIFEEEIQ